jgi:ribosomal-protein-alanine acetyltransferase
MDIQIRAYAPDDFEALYLIDQACYPRAIAYSRATLREFLALPDADCLVAEKDDNIVGFILSESEQRQGHIITIDVLKPYRRKAVGSALLQDIEKRAAERGVREIVLETATANEAAVSFWRKHGYRTRGVLRNYYPGRLDAFSMIKRLAGSKETHCSFTRQSSSPSSRA